MKTWKFTGLVQLSLVLLTLTSCTDRQTKPAPEKILLTQEQVSALAAPALACVQKPYPYKPGGVLASEEALKTPGENHPSFYGCFDWHSAVHGHWTLVKLLKANPNLPEADEIREKLAENLSADKLVKETAFFSTEGNSTFERTYGWAWYLKLTMEMESWDDPLGRELSANLKPLADTLVRKFIAFLSVLTYPIRVGEHSNTAFGLTFAWDYAVQAGEQELQELIHKKAMEFYYDDTSCPLNWEPSGFDFLSPCLIEADLMSRLLDRKEFAGWLEHFLPGLLKNTSVLEPARLTDRSDPKIVHLDGLNLSRAWCLSHISQKLYDTPGVLDRLAYEHLSASLPYIASGAYEGEHWLASFATFAIDAQR